MLVSYVLADFTKPLFDSINAWMPFLGQSSHQNGKIIQSSSRRPVKAMLTPAPLLHSSMLSPAHIVGPSPADTAAPCDLKDEDTAWYSMPALGICLAMVQNTCLYVYMRMYMCNICENTF